MGLKNAFANVATDEELVLLKRETIDAQTQLLTGILTQLKLINLHLAEAFETTYDVIDIEYDQQDDLD